MTGTSLSCVSASRADLVSLWAEPAMKLVYTVSGEIKISVVILQVASKDIQVVFILFYCVNGGDLVVGETHQTSALLVGTTHVSSFSNSEGSKRRPDVLTRHQRIFCECVNGEWQFVIQDSKISPCWVRVDDLRNGKGRMLMYDQISSDFPFLPPDKSVHKTNKHLPPIVSVSQLICYWENHSKHCPRPPSEDDGM